jgi:hypothetical protein
LIRQNQFDVTDDPFGLGSNVGRQRGTGIGGIQRDLAGAEQQITDPHGLMVRTHGRNGTGGANNTFLFHG